MTKKDLNQLLDLREEIKELDLKIKRLSEKKAGIVQDKVQASTREFPYLQTTSKIEGYDYIIDSKIRKQKREKEVLLKRRRQQASELELRITEYINSIGSSKIRRMIEYKYIDGKTWEEIGKIFCCDRTTAEKNVAKYLKENP